MNIIKQSRKLSVNLVAWTFALYVYALFNFYLSGQDPLWDPNKSNVGAIAIYLGILLGFLQWLSDYIIHTSPTFKKLPYTIIALLNGIFLIASLVGVILLLHLFQIWAELNHIVITASIIDFNFFSTSQGISFLIYAMLIRLIVAFIEQMGRLIGGRVLLNIGLGRYHHPKYEYRAFLFIDMSDSTTHAEQLGDFKFSRLVQDCFLVFSDIAARHNAEIYRYMGDAVIVSWPVKSAVDNLHILRIYFEFSQELVWQREFFQREYGFTPKFTAAGHSGQVVAALIGEYRQEISYFSDIINTASRLQGECKRLNQQLIISSNVFHQLDYDYLRESMFAYSYLGNLPLKGKVNEIEAYAFKLKQQLKLDQEEK